MGSGIKYVAIVSVVSLAVLSCGSAPEPERPNETGSGAQPHEAAPAAAPLRNGERFVDIGLERPYRPVAPEGGTDEYRCFLLDPELTAAEFVTGSQFLPQNGEIVHHAILYSISAAEAEQARDVDAATEGDGWQCFGGTGLAAGLNSADGNAGAYLDGWAPGSKETLIGDISGYRLEAGSRIVLQVHYNLLTTNGKPGPTDHSSVRLRLMPGTADVTPLHGQLLPAPIELPCTPAESGPLCDRQAAIADLVKRTGDQARATVDGLNLVCNRGRAPAAGTTQHCDHRMREPALLYAVAPHMHLLGRAITVELNPGTAGARMVLEQPDFNFHNQSNQVLGEPVRVAAGDTVRVSCTHDAELRAQLPELQTLQPRYVVWGDGTSDEMCLAILTLTDRT